MPFRRRVYSFYGNSQYTKINSIKSWPPCIITYYKMEEERVMCKKGRFLLAFPLVLQRKSCDNCWKNALCRWKMTVPVDMLELTWQFFATIFGKIHQLLLFCYLAGIKRKRVQIRYRTVQKALILKMFCQKHGLFEILK